MRIDIITLFPELFKSSFSSSIIKRAQDKKLILINYINLRDFGIGKHKQVDDKPFGGGIGMILKVDVLDKAIQFAKKNTGCKTPCIILLDARGKQLVQKKVRNLSLCDHLIIVCGHYEGVDERVLKLVDEQISIGPYILTGGEIPAMVLVETVSRLLPGVISKKEAVMNESFTTNNLEYPQYTRPSLYKNMAVPKELLSGNHELIKRWKIKKTKNIVL